MRMGCLVAKAVMDRHTVLLVCPGACLLKLHVPKVHMQTVSQVVSIARLENIMIRLVKLLEAVSHAKMERLVLLEVTAVRTIKISLAQMALFEETSKVVDHLNKNMYSKKELKEHALINLDRGSR